MQLLCCYEQYICLCGYVGRFIHTLTCAGVMPNQNNKFTHFLILEYCSWKVAYQIGPLWWHCILVTNGMCMPWVTEVPYKISYIIFRIWPLWPCMKRRTQMASWVAVSWCKAPSGRKFRMGQLFYHQALEGLIHLTALDPELRIT